MAKKKHDGDGGEWDGFDPRFDGRPSRNPYPRDMPRLNTVAQTGPAGIDVHARAYRHHERTVHEGLVVWESGDRAGTRQLATAIRRMHALQQEMTGAFVELDERCRRVLTFDAPGDGVAA